MLSARNRELLGLVPAALLVTAGFAAIFIQAENNSPGASNNVTLNHASNASLTYGAIFLGLCLLAHLVIRYSLPHADPYLFPLAAVLASVGIVMIYRINPVLARQQAQWLVVGLVLFVATIYALRRRGVAVLERYRYTIATVGIVATVLPRLPGIGRQVNGAYLAIHIGSVSFQPAELAKVAIVIFLASYLRDNRQLLVTAGRRVLGLTIPPMKQFGPMLIVWGAAIGVLLLTRELGTSLMFYGAFLALLYVATGRFSFPFIGLVLFALGAWFVTAHVSHVHARVLAWEHPFDKSLYERSSGGSYQLAQSLFAQADGGLLGTGFDQSLLRLPHQSTPILPVPESDTIYAVIVNELGLVGATGLLLVYLLFIARGLKTAVLARDSFSKLLAVGLSFVIALQVFVIVGGVTRVIPLTGVTLPLVAYGGSSVVMNFVLLALLLVVSERARRPVAGSARRLAPTRS
ncbi:MAG TPA: FtsW/RodA/SpoVE family cell cycle protein [Solirubrobacteraceae bacterium]|jgi:cell division protein FtsW (lipid II flippase)|nr:FtsW/RodA/SpoVE family cell cycle protein [Solirubrobacteraceae bacterium]